MYKLKRNFSARLDKTRQPTGLTGSHCSLMGLSLAVVQGPKSYNDAVSKVSAKSLDEECARCARGGVARMQSKDAARSYMFLK